MKTRRFHPLAATMTLSGAIALGLLAFVAGSSSLPMVVLPEAMWLTFVKTIIMGSHAIGAVVALLTLPVLFVSWSPGLLLGAARVPARSFVLAGVVAVSSCAYLVTFWSSGLGFPGLAYLQMIGAINLGCLAVVVVLAALAVKRPGFTWNLAFHWLLFAWLGSYAFAPLTE